MVAGWSLANHTPLYSPNQALYKRGSIYAEPTPLDVNHDGIADIVTVDQLEGKIEVFSGGGSQDLLGTISLGANVEPSTVWSLPTATSQRLLAVMRTDGFLTIYDSNLAPLYAPSPSIPGIQAGGYYGTGAGGPCAHRDYLSIDGGNIDRIVVRTNRQSLLKLNAESASLVEPPPRCGNAGAWCLPCGEPGSPRPASQASVPPRTSSIPCEAQLGRRLDLVGTHRGLSLNDIVPAKLDTDDITDLIYQWGTDGDLLLRTRGVSGATAELSGMGSPSTPARGATAGFAVSDWNADGIDDVLFARRNGGTRALSGTNGLVITANGLVQDAYALTIPFDVDGDGVEESHLSCHVRSGAPSPLTTFRLRFGWATKTTVRIPMAPS